MFHYNVCILIVITVSVVFLYRKEWGKKLVWNYNMHITARLTIFLRFFLQEEKFLYLTFFLQLTDWDKSSGMGTHLVIIIL